jgi:hypothetical protein
MSETLVRDGLDELLDDLTRDVSPEVVARIARLRTDPDVQKRLDYLAERSTEGLLTKSERREYSEFVEAIDVLAVARLRYRRQAASA